MSTSLHSLKHILFFDVESVSLHEKYDDLDAQGQELWKRKSHQLYRQKEDLDYNVAYAEKAGIFAEFAKVVCISVGYLAPTNNGDDWEFRLKTFYHKDEAIVLSEFADMLTRYYNDVSIHSLCGHNIREFDIPFISRRMLVNNIKLPAIIDIRYAKPWEREHLIDTLQDWKFGDYKNYTSLATLCYTFQIPSPKDTMSGADVHKVYYADAALDKIAIYCEDDVIATMRVYLRLQNLIVDDSDIQIVSVTNTQSSSTSDVDSYS